MQEEKNIAAAIISVNFKLAFCPIIWFPEDIYCEQNFKQAERTFEGPGVCTCTSNCKGRYHLTPGRRTLPPDKGLHDDLGMWVLPSVFKTVSILYKSLAHLKSPSSTNSKRNPGDKQMNKNILYFHIEHLKDVGVEVHTPQRRNSNNWCARFSQFRSLKKNKLLSSFTNVKSWGWN